MRGAWIEIMVYHPSQTENQMSLPVRGAWIEIKCQRTRIQDFVSLPVRGAWIEMFYALQCPEDGSVAPREGSVD